MSVTNLSRSARRTIRRLHAAELLKVATPGCYRNERRIQDLTAHLAKLIKQAEILGEPDLALMWFLSKPV